MLYKSMSFINNPNIVVIGGGAAGIFAAINAKNLLPSIEIILLEAHSKPLGKVKVSGGGRCNLTHECFTLSSFLCNYPRGQRELCSVMTRFGPQDTIRWFESHDVQLKTEPDGRIFPTTDSSQTIIDSLLQEITRLRISIKTKHPVQSVSYTDGCFKIKTPLQTLYADKVLLATGSSKHGYILAKELGHSLIKPVPSLFAFHIIDNLIQGLSGIGFNNVKGILETDREKPISQQGDLLITHHGLSGPLILKLSSWGARSLNLNNYRGKLHIDFFPNTNQETLKDKLQEQKNQTPARQLKNENPLGLPVRFWQNLLLSHNMSLEQRWAELSNKNINLVCQSLKRYMFEINGKNLFREEFVTAGGISLKEVNMKTMESKCCKGLYFAGEILDIDALTGGYNLQNAWSTGRIAGESMVAIK